MIRRWLQKTPVFAILAMASYGPTISAQQVDRAALRALTPPPRETMMHTLSLTIGMGYGIPEGSYFYWEGRKFPAEIARIQLQLQRATLLQRVALSRQLGEYYRLQGDRAKAQEAFEKAVTLCAEQLTHQSAERHNGRFLAEYAFALQEAGHIDEAEAQARNAVRLAPHSWQARVASGRVRMTRAQKMTTADRPAARQLETPLSATTQKAWNEAQHDFDAAVRLAPNLPQPYEGRLLFRSARAFAMHPESMRNSLSGLPDLEHIALLRPHDPYAQALLAWLEYSDYGTRYFPNQSYDNFAVWKVLPPANRQRLLRVQRHVEQMTTSHDSLLRAQAYTGLAWLEYEFHNVSVAQARNHLRLALKSQPDFPEAERYLMHTFAVEGDWKLLAQFSEECSQRHPTVRYHLLAAYAYYKLNQPDQTEAQNRAALQLKPEDPAANLFLAFLLIHGPSQDRTAEAPRRLDAAETGMAMAGSSMSDAKTECAALRGFAFALLGRSDEARQQFSQVLQVDENNLAVRKGLALLPP